MQSDSQLIPYVGKVVKDHVKYMIKNREKREEELYQFRIKHGLIYKRPEHYRNCLVIRWKTTRNPFKKGSDCEMTPLHHKRIGEYVKISHSIADKYDLWDKNDILLEEELRLYKVGIDIHTQCYHKLWAIPDEFKDIQKLVLRKLPKWAKATKKGS